MLRSKWTFWGVLAVGAGGAFILAGFTALPAASAIYSAVGAAIANYIFSVSNIPRSCRLRIEAEMTAEAERYYNNSIRHDMPLSSSAHILTVVGDSKAAAANDARSTVTAAAASLAVTVSPTITTNLITLPSQPSEIALTMRPS